MKIISIILLLTVLLSCRNSNDGYVFDSLELEELNEAEVLESVTLLSPQSMWLIKNYLMIADKYDGKLLTVVSTDSAHTTSRILNIGNGPDDFIKISGIWHNPDSDEIMLIDNRTRRFAKYKCNSQMAFNSESRTWHASFAEKGDLFDLIPFHNGFIANGCFEDNMFALLDDTFETEELFGKYPLDAEGIGTQGFTMSNQTILATDPSFRHFFAAGVFGEWLTFYSETDKGISLEKEYFGREPDVDVISFQTGKAASYTIAENDKTRRAFRDLCSSSSYVYALFWGISSKDMDKEGNMCSIFKYTFDGTFVKGWRINRLLRSIAVDEDDATLYAVDFSPTTDEKLRKYNL